MKKLIPVGNKILVEPISSTEEQVGKIVVNSTSGELAEAIVVDFATRYLDVYKKGDKVLYAKKSGLNVISDNKPCILLDGANDIAQGDIWAIVTPD